MITVKDWIAFLPEEDKHIAYVGEHQTVQRQFLLTGPGWEEYADWGFHLDMAFDLSTVTSREQHTLEKTQVNNTENITETQIKTTGNTTKESFVVEEVEVDCAAETDIATLTKTVLEDGVQLTWEVLRQHTQLPGTLHATLRALGPLGQVKKSSLMVFEVEPAVVADAAAEIPQSEFEVMEQRMDSMLSSALRSAHIVEMNLERSEEILTEATAAKNAANSWGNYSKSWGVRAEAAADFVNVETRRQQGILDQVVVSQTSTNLLDMNQVTFGKGMDKSGSIGATTAYDLSLTGFIPVKEGDCISYQRTNAETGERELWCLYLTCLFDENKQVTRSDYSFPPDENGTLKSITIPSGVSYVRLTLHDLPTSLEPALVLGEELVPYEPYNATYWLKKEGYRLEDLMELLHPVQTVAQTLTEAQKIQARANIGALSEHFSFPVDTSLNANSYNPVCNKAVVEAIQKQIFPRLLPEVTIDETYYILRVKMNGEGFEFIPIQQDAYIQNWILPYLLPQVSDSDNGKTLQVVNGTWQLV